MSGKILLNETYAVAQESAAEWQKWMTENYIPGAMASGLIDSYIFSEVNNGDNEGALSFALQFILKDRPALWSFEKDTDRTLKEQMTQKFAGKYASFPTILNIINQN